MENRKYAREAKAFCEAIRILTERSDSLESLECYLSHHFDTWLKKYANTPEGIVAEMMDFANVS